MPTIASGGQELEQISDAIDDGACYACSPCLLADLGAVNVLKGRLWNEESEFDQYKDKTQFRLFYDDACDRVKAFYQEQHGERTSGFHGDVLTIDISPEKQTVAFNIKCRVDFKSKRRARMGVWEAMEKLNTLIDESDLDVRERGFHLRSGSLP